MLIKCEGNPLVTGGCPLHKRSVNAEIVSTPWRYRGVQLIIRHATCKKSPTYSLEPTGSYSMKTLCKGEYSNKRWTCRVRCSLEHNHRKCQVKLGGGIRNNSPLYVFFSTSQCKIHETWQNVMKPSSYIFNEMNDCHALWRDGYLFWPHFFVEHNMMSSCNTWIISAILCY